MNKNTLFGTILAFLSIIFVSHSALAQIFCPGTQSRPVVCRDYQGNQVADAHCDRLGVKPLVTKSCMFDCTPQPSQGDPLIFDLDGNGISLISPTDGVLFDIDNDGIPDKSGWVDSGDGLLALDKNRNGRIDGQSELFGTEGKRSFSNLSEFDRDKNGKIDWNDQIYSHLRMWVDSNQNGKTDRGELKKLWNDLRITEISLEYDTLDEIHNENQVTGKGTFTRIKENGQKVVSEVMEAFFGFVSGE